MDLLLFAAEELYKETATTSSAEDGVNQVIGFL